MSIPGRGWGCLGWVYLEGERWVCPGLNISAMHVMLPTPNPRGQTHACENITFPQLPLRATTRVGSHSPKREKRFLVLVNFGGTW